MPQEVPIPRLPGEGFSKENIFDLEKKGVRRLKEEMAEKKYMSQARYLLLIWL